MDNQRLLIWATFGLLLWLSYEAWMQDHAPAPELCGRVVLHPGFI